MDSAQLPDLEGLDREALKALLVQHQEQLISLAASHEDELRLLEAELESQRNILSEQSQELRSSSEQIDHLKLPQTPTGPGIHYKGWVQAKEDSWDMTGYHFGPKEGKPGEVFQVDMPDYWPGCPFTPVIIKGTREDGLPITAPHPDFLSH